VTCMWFALCDNEAEFAVRGPIGDGQFGLIPVCGRCVEKLGLAPAARVSEIFPEEVAR
jgi:hypothetical protein